MRLGRTSALAITTLLVGGAAVIGAGTPGASAATAPITGNVACSVDGSSTFTPYLGYAPGIQDPHIPPSVDSKWKVAADLTDCTGTQSGGSPRKPGPITNGELFVKATAFDHACQKVTDLGLTVNRFRVRWHNAQGKNLGTSKGNFGHVSADGLFNGWPSDNPFSPTPTHPGYVAPGIITMQGTGTVDTAARVLPGTTFTFSMVADQTIADDMQGPCSYIGPPARQGVRGFDFHGEHGASSISIG